jgi:hypothetical protein
MDIVQALYSTKYCSLHDNTHYGSEFYLSFCSLTVEVKATGELT